MNSGRKTSTTTTHLVLASLKKASTTRKHVVVEESEPAINLSYVVNQTEPTIDLQLHVDPDFIQPDAITGEKEIDSGALGKIYKAIWGNQSVVVKKYQYKIGVTVSEEITQGECENEKNILKYLTSNRAPHTVQYYGYSTRAINAAIEEFSIIMQHVPGGSLADYIRKHPENPFELSIKYRILQETISAVAFLHSQKPPIFHRDIKAGNILLDADRHAVLCDFGLSVMTDKNPEDYCGTDAWIAPEVWREKKQTLGIDVYSFGITVWEVFVWKHPFLKLNSSEIRESVVEGERPPIPDNLPEKINLLLRWTILKSPEKRPSSQIVKEELSSPINTISERLQKAPQYKSSP